MAPGSAPDPAAPSCAECGRTARGHARRHYRTCSRSYAKGRPRLDAETRFWRHVEKRDDGCWIWVGAKIRAGYGHFQVEGKYVKTHRWSYEHFVGPIPDGLQIDHLCRVVACCNPAHLEPVTALENIRRSAGNASKQACHRGHLFDSANTKWGIRRSGPAEGQRYRQCRACQEENSRRAVDRRRAARGFRPGYCPNGHDRAVVGTASNGRWPTCAECRRLSSARAKARATA